MGALIGLCLQLILLTFLLAGLAFIGSFFFFLLKAASVGPVKVAMAADFAAAIATALAG